MQIAASVMRAEKTAFFTTLFCIRIAPVTTVPAFLHDGALKVYGTPSPWWVRNTALGSSD